MKRLSSLLKSFLVGVAAGFNGGSPRPIDLTPIRRAWTDFEHSQADYRVRRVGSVRYNYDGAMISLDQGGMLNRTRTWKTVTDRDLRNRCTEGTGISEDDPV